MKAVQALGFRVQGSDKRHSVVERAFCMFSIKSYLLSRFVARVLWARLIVSLIKIEVSLQHHAFVAAFVM